MLKSTPGWLGIARKGGQGRLLPNPLAPTVKLNSVGGKFVQVARIGGIAKYHLTASLVI